MPGVLGGIYGIWLREFKVFQREKSRVISSIVTPLMWLVIVGGGLGGSISPVGFSYQAFMFPGIVMMLALFSSVFFGLYIVWDRKIDVLKEILVSPVPRTAIFFGKVLGGCTDVILQVCVFLVIGVFFAPMSAVIVVAALGIAMLVAIGMVSVGLTIGSFFESLEGFQVIVSFLVFPLFFLSGALYPLNGGNVPAWLTTVSYFDPLTYGVDALRSIQLGTPSAIPLPIDFAVIIGFAAVMVVVGTLAFKRMK
jgi:ABC-2 type transport system permease protein